MQMAMELALRPSVVLAAAPDSEWWRLGSTLLLHRCATECWPSKSNWVKRAYSFPSAFQHVEQQVKLGQDR